MPTIAEAHLDDTQRVHECLEKIMGASKHLLSLINDVLDVSRIESGRIVLTEEAFSLPEFVQRLFAPFERAEDERLKGIQGTGLGMVITKNILRMMIQPPVRALP